MNAEVTARKPGRIARLLAVASVAGFWLLPFSPLVAIGAVSMTAETTGSSRRLALAGAALCIAHTTAMALLTARLAWVVAF